MFRQVPASELQRANKVAFRYQLYEVELVSCECQRQKSFVQMPDDFRFDLESADTASHELVEGGARLVCRIQFSMKAMVNGDADQESRQAFSVAAVFELSYRRMVDEPLEAADFDSFTKWNALHNCWPYLRELVQGFTVRMGFPALVMEPLLILPQQPTKKPDPKLPGGSAN